MLGVGRNVKCDMVICVRTAHPGELSQNSDFFNSENSKPLYGRKERSALFAMTLVLMREKRNKWAKPGKLALFQNS